MDTLKVYNPYDRSLIKEIPKVGKDEVETAIKAAHKLHQKHPQGLPAFQRIAILTKAAEIMQSRVEDLTKTAAEEGGKPYTDSKVEVLRAINGMKLALEHIPHLTGEQVPMGITESSQNRIAFTTREPIGVVSAISAFNHPLNLIVHQAATALAAGCPVLVKPASSTPLSCLAFAEIMAEAGLPKGWLTVLICSGRDAEALATDNRIGFLTFIGSAKVGWSLRSKLAPGTRCALEHGGAAPVIVEQDADLEDALPAIAKGGFYHAGQVCVSVQRVYVHDSIAKKVAKELANIAEKLVVGDPLDPKTEVGPLIETDEVDRVNEWVEEAVAKGGKLLYGGKRISKTCYAPTVILDPPDDVRASAEEIFGPVVCVYSYNDRDKAIARANRLDLHFQAAVFTKNLDIALDTVKKLNATAVMVNDHTAFRVDWMPFGGRDASGLGIGGIQHSMRDMTREKLMVIKSSVL
jgi:acyl-CoA reductase-like NAD-dependent aldehyde dehydrogenase